MTIITPSESPSLKPVACLATPAFDSGRSSLAATSTVDLTPRLFSPRPFHPVSLSLPHSHSREAETRTRWRIRLCFVALVPVRVDDGSEGAQARRRDDPAAG